MYNPTSHLSRKAGLFPWIEWIVWSQYLFRDSSEGEVICLRLKTYFGREQRPGGLQSSCPVWVSILCVHSLCPLCVSTHAYMPACLHYSANVRSCVHTHTCTIVFLVRTIIVSRHCARRKQTPRKCQTLPSGRTALEQSQA